MTRLVISNLIKKETNFYIKLHFSGLEEYDGWNESAVAVRKKTGLIATLIQILCKQEMRKIKEIK